IAGVYVLPIVGIFFVLVHMILRVGGKVFLVAFYSHFCNWQPAVFRFALVGQYRNLLLLQKGKDRFEFRIVNSEKRTVGAPDGHPDIFPEFYPGSPIGKMLLYVGNGCFSPAVPENTFSRNGTDIKQLNLAGSLLMSPGDLLLLVSRREF